jgi:hypothetical protein
MLVVSVVALSGGDVPLWALAVVLATTAACTWLGILLWSRFTDEGQAERLAEESAAGDQPRKSVLKSLTFAYAALAIGSLVAAFQGLLNPAQGNGEGLGVSSLLLAAVFAFLALREHRKGRVEPDLSITGNPLAALNAPPSKPALTKPAPIASPATTLIVIAVFVILLVIADVRMILTPSGPNDEWIGAGQTVIWLPVFGYAAYREVRRMRPGA